MTAYKYWVSGITCHMYSREERTRLTGEINYISALIPGAERHFRRSLHVTNCRDRLMLSSGFQEKGGCPLIIACSVITSITVCACGLSTEPVGSLNTRCYNCSVAGVYKITINLTEINIFVCIYNSILDLHKKRTINTTVYVVLCARNKQKVSINMTGP